MIGLIKVFYSILFYSIHFSRREKQTTFVAIGALRVKLLYRSSCSLGRVLCMERIALPSYMFVHRVAKSNDSIFAQ